MRFMLLLIPKGGPGVLAMRGFNESLRRAGVLLALDALHPRSSAVRISFTGGRARVAEGPLDEDEDPLGGFWMIQAKSRDEAVAWASRCPASDDEVVEVRQVREFTDEER
jgi:hypothetical protein